MRGGGGARWALVVQSRHRRWAGLTFFRPGGQEGIGGGREAGAGQGVGGGGGRPTPNLLVPNGGPAHGLHPRFVVA